MSLLAHGGTGIFPVQYARMRAMAHIQKRRGAYLPHWTEENGIYSVRLRLADSVPQEKLREWVFERKDILETAKTLRRKLSPSENLDLARLHTEIVERFLRNGHGSCWLQTEQIAKKCRTLCNFLK